MGLKAMPEGNVMGGGEGGWVEGQRGDVGNDEDVPVLSDDEYYDDRFMDLIEEMDDSHNYSGSGVRGGGGGCDSF